MSSSNNNLKNLDLEKIPSAKNFRFGIVVSKWNSKITTNLLNGCLELLYNKGVNKEDIDIVREKYMNALREFNEANINSTEKLFSKLSELHYESKKNNDE